MAFIPNGLERIRQFFDASTSTSSSYVKGMPLSLTVPLAILLPSCCYYFYFHRNASRSLSSKPTSSNITTTTSKTDSTAPFSPLFSAAELHNIYGTSSTITLRDGRQLGYAVYGVPFPPPTTSQPSAPNTQTKNIIYLHGLPGSRLEAYALSPVAEKLNARVIAVDRPGYGLSSLHGGPGATMLSFAEDVAELVRRLDLDGADGVGVLGISGGGPYALALAANLQPQMLRAVSIVCGIGSRDMVMRSRGQMAWLHWLGFAFGFRYVPWVCRWWLGRQPVAQLQLGDEERLRGVQRGFEEGRANGGMHAKDVAVGEGEGFRLYCLSAKEMLRDGTEAYARDGRLICREWGFEIEDIRKDLPVQLWYGSLDDSVPASQGLEIQRRLGENARLVVREETHWSVGVNLREEYLEGLVGMMTSARDVDERL